MFNERPFTVVGVLAEGFYFPTPDAEVWIPYVIPAFYRPQPGNPGRQRIIIVSVTALGRLRPGVSEEQAATEVRTILQRNADTPPAIAAAMSRAMLTTAGGGAAGGRAAGEGAGGDTPEVDAQVLSLREEMVGGYRPALLALTVATALVLLIAGSNVAGLLLARGGHAPAGTGGLRGAGRGPGPHRETAPDRERGAEPDRRGARAGGGHPGDPRRPRRWSPAISRGSTR